MGSKESNLVFGGKLQQNYFTVEFYEYETKCTQPTQRENRES